MKLYTSKIETASAKTIVADDMLLTTAMPTAAGSKMLDGYMSLLGAEALDRAVAAGYVLGGKADVGEFAIDLVGETSYNGACVADGKLVNASAEIVSYTPYCAMKFVAFLFFSGVNHLKNPLFLVSKASIDLFYNKSYKFNEFYIK